MLALSAMLRIFSFQFSLLFFNISCLARQHHHCGILLVLICNNRASDIAENMGKYLSCAESTAHRKDWIYYISGLKSQDLEILWAIFHFIGKRPLMVKFPKFCSKSFHRLTDRGCCVKISWIGWAVGEIVLYLPDRINFGCLSLSLLHGSRLIYSRASPQQCTHSAPDFIQIRSLSAELQPNAWTPIFAPQSTCISIMRPKWSIASGE